MLADRLALSYGVAPRSRSSTDAREETDAEGGVRKVLY